MKKIAKPTTRKESTTLTAFRLPIKLSAWVRNEARRRKITMTDVVIEALEAKR